MIYASPCHFVPATGRFGLTLLMGSLLLPVLGCGRGTPAVSPAATQAALPDIPQLCSRIDAALTHAREARRLDASVNGAWQVVHGILAFGPELPLVHDGKESAALDYLLGGGRLTGGVLRGQALPA